MVPVNPQRLRMLFLMILLFFYHTITLFTTGRGSPCKMCKILSKYVKQQGFIIFCARNGKESKKQQQNCHVFRFPCEMQTTINVEANLKNQKREAHFDCYHCSLHCFAAALMNLLYPIYSKILPLKNPSGFLAVSDIASHFHHSS